MTETPSSETQSGVESDRGRGRLTLYLMTFIMGGCGLAYEYTFSKISSDLMGNSVRQWAVTIGLMMFFMGVGSDVQKHLRDRRIFNWFILFEILLGLIGGFGPILLIWVFGSFRDHYVLIQYGLIVSTGFLIGMEIPILTRINERYTETLKVNIGGILRMDYIGAFAGALCWVFLLQRFFSLTRIGFVLGFLNLVTAGISLWYFRRLVPGRAWLTVVTLLGGVGLLAGFGTAPRWTRHAQQKLYLDRIIYAESTRYQHIVLTRSSAGDVFCYINGNTQFSSADEHIYHEFLVHPAMGVAPRRKNVLVLGGGDGLAVREILKYPDLASVTLVDLDPKMTDLARTNPHLTVLNRNSLADARLMVLQNHALVDAEPGPVGLGGLFGRDAGDEPETVLVNLDASVFVEQISGFYDVIIIDFPDPNNLELAKLYSLGFYQNVKAKLSRHGILVQQSTSPVHSREAFLCIGRTMRAAGLAVVPFHENVPVFGEWGWWLGGKEEVYSEDGLVESIHDLDLSDISTRYLTPELARASLAFGKDSLVSEEQQISTIFNNFIYRYYSDALTETY